MTDRKVSLPALPRVTTGNPALDRLLQAICERLEVREGARGDALEQVVTFKDLEASGLANLRFGTRGRMNTGGVLVQQADGSYLSMPIDEFADSIRKTKLYGDLMKRLDDPTRFDDYPEAIKKILLNSIADEAAKRGADIQRLDYKIQSEVESLAYTVQEVTAAVQGAASGVREVTFASATANRATAGQVTQIQARLDDVGGVTIEESMIATADRVQGLAGEYMVKINAGGAVAGFGLAASEDPQGNTESSFIVQADKFAIVTSSASETPHIPFGVDANGVYINGTVRINAAGATLNDLAAATGVYISYDTQFFKYTSTGAVVNSTLTMTANLTGDIPQTSKVTWSVLGGYSGTPPAAATTNNWTIDENKMLADSASFQITIVDDFVTYTDTITVAKLRDGTDSITGMLTNDPHQLTATDAGVVSSFAGAVGTFDMYRGFTKITTGNAITYSVLSNPSALDVTINSATGVYAVTGGATWAASGSTPAIVTFRANYKGADLDKTFTLSKAMGGVKGSDGSSARTVILSMPRDGAAITYNSDNTRDSTVSSDGYIRFFATKANTVLDAFYEFQVDGSTVQTGSSQIYDYTKPSAYFGSPKKITVNLREGSAIGAVVASDVVNVFGVIKGSSAINVILTNETHTLPADSSGTVTSYANSGTDIRVYEGATELTYDESGTTAGKWRIATSSGGIGVGAISAANVSVSRAIVGVHNTMTSDAAVITYTVSGKTMAGNNFSMVKTQTFAKARAGVTPAAAANGKRGSLIAYVTATSEFQVWAARTGGRARWCGDGALNETNAAFPDNLATSTICSIAGVSANTANLTIGDTVTITRTNLTPNRVATGYWDGYKWAHPGVVIDGNLLVSGSVAADAIAGGTITADIKLAATKYLAASGAGDGAITAYPTESTGPLAGARPTVVHIVANSGANAITASANSTDTSAIIGNNVGGGPGILAASTGGSPIRLQVTSAQPNPAAVPVRAGDLCVVGSAGSATLYFYNGSAWKTVLMS